MLPLAMIRPCISVVLPVYNERENIAACLRGLWQALAEHEHEILVCYDFDQDDTLPAIAAMTDKPPSVRLVKNSLGRGAAFAIRAGFDAARGDVVVTTMADLCDPPAVIPLMARKIREEGADVVAGSRYMRGGSQSGGPFLKRTISRWVGWSMWWIADLGTHDATTNFRAYSKRFLESVAVESKTSFDIALELTVKAHLAGAEVSEVPSSWIDRTAGESRFQMWKWMPNYLRWYVRAMLPPLIVLALLVGISISGWMQVGRTGASALRTGQALSFLIAACVLMLWLARRTRGRTRTLDAAHVLVWLLPWQIWSLGSAGAGVGWIAIAVSSLAWLGFTCGWKRTFRTVHDIATGRGKRSGQATLGLFLIGALVWLASIILPRQIAASDPDLCWSRSLGYALTHGLRFGSEIAFTYGPLGYFTTGIFERELFTLKVVAFEGAFKLLAAAFLTLGSLRMAGTLDRAIYFLAILLLPYHFDAYAFTLLACVTAHLITNPHGNPAFSLGGVFLLAVLSLTKFNLVVVAGACMLAVATARLADLGWPAALSALGAFGGFHLALWLLCGQSLLDLPSYFARSAEIAQGYNEGESEVGNEGALYAGIALAVLMLVLVALYALERPRTRAALALGAALVLIVFVAFKTGFVRIADHPSIFFVFAAAGVFLIPSPARAEAWARATGSMIRLACVTLVLLCLPPALDLEFRGWPDLVFPQVRRTASNIEGLSDLSRLRTKIEADEDRTAKAVHLPRVRQVVGRETIDMVSCEQALLYLNDLEWRPRPVFMSYATMTPGLLEWNARFFEGDRAPRFILSRLNTIDMRMATMDDGLALQVVGRDYAPVLVEKGLILLERHPDGRRDALPRTVLRRTIAFGERVEIEGLAGQSHVLKLDIPYTAFGKFWMTAFKAPPLWMNLWLDTGDKAVVRVVPGMMKTGVLFDPFIHTQEEWIEWLTRGSLRRVRAIAVVPPESPSMYADELEIEILDADPQAPAFDRERSGISGLSGSSESGTFDPEPAAISASAPTSRRRLEGHDVLVVQAPSQIRFEIASPGTFVLSAAFGLVPEAYTTHSSDGVSFSALVEESPKKSLLFHRFVDPRHRLHDRGVQYVVKEFTTTGPAVLYLYANPGIHNDEACDWAYWGAVRIAEQLGR